MPGNEAGQRDDQRGCWERTSHRAQAGCYQIMAHTFWDRIVSGFKPARQTGINYLDIQPTDRILFVGEGAGADFECLPASTNWDAVKAIDFSSQMVTKCRAKAVRFGIPVDNCMQADAQDLPFEDGCFDKIFFPLSLGSIPNPQRALLEAERILAPQGKITLFEKLVDDGERVSRPRRCLNFFTNCIFADITRNLTDMMGGDDSPLKITQYESLQGQINGCFRCVGHHYRVAVLTRKNEYIDKPAITAQPS